MAKEGVSDLLGAKGVINRQSWPNKLQTLRTKWKLLFFPSHILDHAYYWKESQVEVSGRGQSGTLLLLSGKQDQLLGRQVGGGGRHLPHRQNH